MQDVVIRGVGLHRSSPRLYLDMAELQRAAFSRGLFYRVDVRADEQRVVVELDDDGDRVVSGKQSKSGAMKPIIDLSSKAVMGIFAGLSQVRLIFSKGRVVILPLASALARMERLARVKAKLASGEPLSVASLAHGGGIMSHAAHAGARDAGVAVRAAAINEIDENLLSLSRTNNSIWDGGTIGVNMPMQEMVQDADVMQRVGRTEVVELGIPCSGHSRAGGTKRKIAIPEAHPMVGHLVVPALIAIAAMQPAVVVVENVQGYQTSASACLLRACLRDMGYATQEVVLDSHDFGAVESRVRWFLVALTEGLRPVDLEGLAASSEAAPAIAEILDPLAEDDVRWRGFSYLFDKAERDRLDGKGFKVQVVKESTNKVGCLRRGYHKGGTVDPLLAHPTKEGLYRLLTGDEHTRCAGVPAELVAGCSDVAKHQVVGQGVAYEVVRRLFARVLGSLQSTCEKAIEPVPYNLQCVG